MQTHPTPTAVVVVRPDVDTHPVAPLLIRRRAEVVVAIAVTIAGRGGIAIPITISVPIPTRLGADIVDTLEVAETLAPIALAAEFTGDTVLDTNPVDALELTEAQAIVATRS